MPGDNFLRFVLFHPDAPGVLGDHEASWCLPMLAHFARTVEGHGPDHGLQAIRRDIAQDPIMEAAYRHGLSHWIRAVGEDAVEQDGAVRPLLTPIRAGAPPSAGSSSRRPGCWRNWAAPGSRSSCARPAAPRPGSAARAAPRPWPT